MHKAGAADFERICGLVSRMDAIALREDELAPHVVLVIDEELGPGTAVGPFDGALPALVAAERLEAALNDESKDPPVRTQVLRLFTRRR
jgi:hypothetical protein